MQILNAIRLRISLRISLIFTALTSLILLLMGATIHQLVMHHFEEQDRDVLEGKLALIENMLAQKSVDSTQLNQRLNDALVGHHGLMVQIERPIGQSIFETLRANIPDQSHGSGQPISLANWWIDQQQYRGLTARHPPTPHMQSYRIVVGIQTKHHTDFMNEFRKELLLIGGIGALSLMVLGWLAARRGLQPVQSMAQLAEGISAQHLAQRLDLQQAPIELRPLAIAFNDMLDRLEWALARLSDFSSDLAHELRTPINNLMTQTQVCLSKPRDIVAYQEVLFSNLEEYERLARMTADMLFLAKADHGLALANVQPVNLREEVIALYDFYDALAAEKNIQLNQSGEATILGNPLMLRRALSNLISNAIRYGKSDTAVQMRLAQDPQLITVTIENSAAPITPEQLSRLFDRFYRTDASRQRIDEGAGLGLAITQSIVHAHQGSIQAFSAGDQVTFQIQFAGQAAPAALILG